MTKYLQDTLKQATGINFYHGRWIDSMDYLLLNFDDPNKILREYQDLATLLDFEKWHLDLEVIVKDRLRISLVSEKENVKIENLIFDRTDLNIFLKKVPTENIIGLCVGQGQTNMTNNFGFTARLRGYSISTIINDQLK